jgi:outer membrane protein OmpA-like peptidoglycan-associated protein
VFLPCILNLAASRRYGPGKQSVNQSGLRVLCILVFIVSSLASAFAQLPMQPRLDPTFDVYGGFSSYNPGGKTNGFDFKRLNRGWTTAASVNFTRRYSLFTEFGSYKNSAVGSAYTYLAGPRFTFHRGPFAPFAQIMMGAEQMAPKGQSRNIAFVEAFGGGLDIAIARRFSVRLFQADFVFATGHEPTKIDQNQFFGSRVSAGLIWNFGKKHKPTVAAEKSAKPGPAAASTTVAEAPTTTSAPATEAPATTTNATATEAPTPAATAPEPSTVPAAAIETASTPVAEAPAKADSATPTSEPSTKPTEEKSAPTAVEEPKAETKPATAQATAPDKPVVEKKSEDTAAEKPIAETTKKIETEKPAETAPASKPASIATVQHVGALTFPYDQYPTLLSPKDKRNLEAVASRLKLEPDATAVIVGNGDRYAPKSAAQRAVNSKDYLVKKGIAADRVKVFELPAPPHRTKQAPAKTELLFVPAGVTYEAPSSTPVDEQHVKPQHLHVAHPEWHEK